MELLYGMDPHPESNILVFSGGLLLQTESDCFITNGNLDFLQELFDEIRESTAIFATMILNRFQNYKIFDGSQ